MLISNCQITHSIILAGKCPSCGSVVVDGKIGSNKLHDGNADSYGLIKWNIPFLLASFKCKPKTFLIEILSIILLHDSRIEPFLPVLREAMRNTEREIRLIAAIILVNRSQQIWAQQAEFFENKLQFDPDDVALRILLLCFHSNTRCSMIEASHANRCHHLLWMIEKDPELLLLIGPYANLAPSTDGAQVYMQAKELWHKQIHNNKDNVDYLAGMAEFFSHQEPDLSESLYKKAIIIQPHNPHLRKRFGDFYYRSLSQLKHYCVRREIALKALTQYKMAFDLDTDQSSSSYLLLDIATLALEANELDAAKIFAQTALRIVTIPQHPMYKDGYIVHHGNILLGRLALKKGEKEKSKMYLLAASQSTGSPVLDSFGPKMALAKELLENGECGVVIDYINNCSIFWHSINHQAQQWIYVIEHGGIPDFGSNM